VAISIRQAEPEDADAVIDVVRKSITELCAADHRHDPDTLATWLDNKTPRDFLEWLENSDNFCVTAQMNGTLSGVGFLHRSGAIRLFFVMPGAQRQGIGRKIHAALEEKARHWALPALHLGSTLLACGFYEALGYQAAGAPKFLFGVLQCYPYEKVLRPDEAGESERGR
jgi:GNAT superfamily N-acetyltransferase